MVLSVAAFFFKWGKRWAVGDGRWAMGWPGEIRFAANCNLR